MSAEPSWPAPGVECVCINDLGWLAPKREEENWGFLIIITEEWVPRDGPAFMQQLKIKDTYLFDGDKAGHKLKLCFDEFPGEWYCACKFRPFEKVEDEETKDITAPVDGELVR